MTSPLFPHQRAAIDMAMEKGNLAIFHSPGLCKTRTTLEIFKRRKEEQPDLKLLAVCPISVIKSAWQKDTALWTPEFTFCDLRKGKHPEQADVIAINYEKVISKKGYPVILDLLKRFKFMGALDESTRIKNHKALTTKTFLKLRDYFQYRHVLSGTPAPNGLHEYWGQMAFTQPGTMTRSYYEFQNRYFRLVRGKDPKLQISQVGYAPGKMMHEGWRLDITDENRDAIIALMAPYVHRMDKKTAGLGLPPKIFQTRLITLTAPERKAYNEIKKHLLTDIGGDVVTAAHRLTKDMKLRQICSGFIYNQLGEPLWIGKSKIKELMAVLEELGDQQVIIWCEFVEEARAVVAVLHSCQCSILYGDTEDKDAEIEQFIKGYTQYLVANPASGSMGIDGLQRCSAQVYFSNSFSFLNYEQTQDRTHRSGQTADSCLYIHLVAENTIEDELIYPALANKGKVSNDDLRKFLRR